MKKNLMRLAIVVVLFIGMSSALWAQGLPTAKPEQVGLSSERLSRIDTYFKDIIDKKEISGAVTLVARHGKIAYFKAYGMADIEDKKPMKKDSLFRICSMTKVISAAAGMMLWEQGRFNLADRVAKYIPAMRRLKVIEYDPTDPSKYTIVPAKNPMLIYHAFNLTAGFTYGFNFLAGAPLAKLLADAGLNSGFWPNDYDDAEYLEKRSQVPLRNQPGEQWNYGNDLQVVARLVEVLSGMSFGDYCREKIFKPLGMNDTYFYPPEEKVARVATLYLKSGAGLEKTERGKTYLNPAMLIEEPLDPFWFAHGPKKYFGAGEGLITSTEDFAKFMQMLLNGGTLNGVRLLSPKTVEFMTTNQIEGITCCQQTLGVQGWGLGVALFQDPGKMHVIGAPGSYYWAGWMSTTWNIDPKEDMYFILMTQRLPSGSDYQSQFRTLVYQSIVK